MNDFDRMGRHAVKVEPPATVRWLFPRLAPRMGFNRWLDSQSAPRPGEPDRRCDTIAELIDSEGTSPPWACVIELFTEPDADAVDRALEYVARFRRELRHGPYGHDRYQFVVALVFFTDAPGVTRLDMNLPGMEEVGLWFGPCVVDVSTQDAVAHLEAIEQNRLPRSLLAWPPLMKGGQSPEFIARWRVQAEAEPDELRRRTMVDVALQFAYLTDSHDIWKKGLEGMLMKESPLMREVRQEGVVATYHATLRRTLQTRFPGAVPAALLKRIEEQTDPAVLSRWFDLSLSARSPEAFEEKMD